MTRHTQPMEQKDGTVHLQVNMIYINSVRGTRTYGGWTYGCWMFGGKTDGYQDRWVPRHMGTILVPIGYKMQYLPGDI